MDWASRIGDPSAERTVGRKPQQTTGGELLVVGMEHLARYLLSLDEDGSGQATAAVFPENVNVTDEQGGLAVGPDPVGELAEAGQVAVLRAHSDVEGHAAQSSQLIAGKNHLVPARVAGVSPHLRRDDRRFEASIVKGQAGRKSCDLGIACGHAPIVAQSFRLGKDSGYPDLFS